MKNILLLFLLLIIVLPVKINSQDTIKKPVVALVLSGGTAKGLVHIGVLKVLEEQGIKPDIIIGTSMGSIIGGLYAIGYSADELEKLTLATDWYKYLSNDTDLRKINIEEKNDFEEFVYNFPIEKRKPTLGKGIIYGHELDLYLNKVTFPSIVYSSFDDFPIKFRAIATDIVNGEVYVFKNGLLSTALRASMSLPTLFEPVEYDGKLLVDGGILDNFGVDIALENGADIIIGSNVGRIMKKPDEFDSYKNLIAQLMMIQSKSKYKKYKDSVDVLIESPVLNMGSRFDKSKEIIDIGYNTALKHVEELAAIKRRLGGKEVNVIKQNHIRDNIYYPISKIAIRGISDQSYKHHIYGILRKSIGLKTNHKLIEQEINKLFGSGQFAFIKYNIEKIANNDYKLVFSFKPLPKEYLQLGIHYNDQSNLGVILGLTLRNSIAPGTKLKIKGRVSKYPGLDEHFVKYFSGNNTIGIKQSFSYIQDKIDIYNNGSRLTSFNRNYAIFGLSLLFIPNKSSMYELGYKYEKSYYKNVFNIEFQNTKLASLRKNNIYLSYYRSTIDDKFFASRGNVLKAKLKYNFNLFVKNENQFGIKNDESPNNYFGINFEWDNYTKLSPKWILESQLLIQLNDFYNTELFILNDKTLGGVNPDNNKQIAFWGLPDNYNLSSSKGIFRTGLRYKVIDKIFIKTAINAAIIDNGDIHLGGGISFTFNSPVGPLSTSIAISEEHLLPIFHISLGYYR